MVTLSIPIVVEGGRKDQAVSRRGSGSGKTQLVKRSSRNKLKTYQIQISLDPEPSDSCIDPKGFKTKPQFLKRRSVPKIGADCDPGEKIVSVSPDSVKHVKLGHGRGSVPGVLTRRQSSGNDLLGLVKTPAGARSALSRRQSGGRQDLLGVDQRSQSCGKRRGALRQGLWSTSIDSEGGGTVSRLSAITLEDSEGLSQFEREALVCHNQYRARHGVCMLQIDRELCTHAQDYADTLATQDTFQHSNDPVYGENLYWSWSSDPAWELHGEEAVHSWYQERRGYCYDKEPQDTESGHFTQLVWAQSHRLGVGLAKSATTGKYITVMKYHPPGNYLGKYRENVFRPANCGGKKIMDL